MKCCACFLLSARSNRIGYRFCFEEKSMTTLQMRLKTAALALALAFPLSDAGNAQSLRGEIEGIVHDYLASHPDEVGLIVKDYLVRHPEVIQQVLTEMIKKRSTPTSSSASASTDQLDRSAVVRNNAKQIFSSPLQVNLGNPDGDVTLVEFFDYNCGFCKRALGDTLDLIKSDSKLKVVLKELPILGPGSVEAARVAIAVHMQDADGKKYLEFHRKLLGDRTQANKARALDVARELGLDLARIEQDMNSPEVNATIDESSKLAQMLGINGTPSYVVGSSVVVGAVGSTTLFEKIKLARQ
jgi:protein-disulfide isomerase